MTKSVPYFIKEYKGVHSTTMLSVLRTYNEWEKLKFSFEKKKWKRGEDQLSESIALERILDSRGIDYERIVGIRK